MNHPQCARRIAMVRPAAFGYNEETASNNFFQQKNSPGNLHTAALQQFDKMVMQLKENAIDILLMEDNPAPAKPDAIFPNNWFSCNNHTITIFPMEAANRRWEKRQELIEQIQNATGITSITDLSFYEAQSVFLEGTGSMVFDHVNKVAYACYSSRTHETLFAEYCAQIKYLPLGFDAFDQDGRRIYHTNVMCCVGERFAVICLEAVASDIDRKKIEYELASTGHEIITISFEQMNRFAGNMLELINSEGIHMLVMSETAYQALSDKQVEAMEKYATILALDISLIESASGGSVRCMMAELFC
jgi:hypothetical protein